MSHTYICTYIIFKYTHPRVTAQNRRSFQIVYFTCLWLCVYTTKLRTITLLGSGCVVLSHIRLTRFTMRISADASSQLRGSSPKFNKIGQRKNISKIYDRIPKELNLIRLYDTSCLRYYCEIIFASIR